MIAIAAETALHATSKQRTVQRDKPVTNPGNLVSQSAHDTDLRHPHPPIDTRINDKVDSLLRQQATLLEKMHELAIQATASNLDSPTQAILQQEFSSLRRELDTIAYAAQYPTQAFALGAGVPLIQGNRLPKNFHIIHSPSLDTQAISTELSSLDLNSPKQAQAAISSIENNMALLNYYRSPLLDLANKFIIPSPLDKDTAIKSHQVRGFVGVTNASHVPGFGQDILPYKISEEAQENALPKRGLLVNMIG